MSQYQRMISYLYEYKQGVKGINVGYARIEQRGKGCRISLQMRRRNLGQLSDVAVFRQGRDGIRYYTVGALTERNGDYRCRIEMESEDLMGSGIRFSDVDGIILYQNHEYYIATTWKNQSVYLGESRVWDPAESVVEEEAEPVGAVESETGDAGMEKPETTGSMDAGMTEQENADPTAAGMTGPETANSTAAGMAGSETTNSMSAGMAGSEATNPTAAGIAGSTPAGASQPGSARHEPMGVPGSEPADERHAGSNDDGMALEQSDIRDSERRMGFPRWTGMPLFRRRSADHGNIPIPQMAEWSNGSSKEQIEEQAVCRNCPFKRKNIDYGKRILMTFPVMRPFPNEQKLACVRIEPQDLGCLPMQMWTLANNHFLLQGYYCYRHLIFMETDMREYALGVPGIYDRRTSRQAEQFGFAQFRAICGGKQCDGAFGYWLMPLSCS